METEKKWWKKAVIYQIYPRSFQDSNHDGIGDLNGIRSRLPYLAELGIDCVWLSPVYRSPQDDNGYDISDYQDIDPIFGSLSDMDQLIAEGRKYHISFLMDLVLNHSSDEHPWFLEAKKSRENPYHDYYVWRDPVDGHAPNQMRANFGGTAWEWVPEVGQYYFHQFSVKQPDLNWENPALREELYRMINWWSDRGVRGFRLDVIDSIAKEPDRQITANGPMLHSYIKELNEKCLKGRDLVTVGEAWSADIESARIYSNPDDSELSMVFQFQHSLLDQQPGKDKWDLMELPFVKLKKVLSDWQVGLADSGWNSLFWNNHDMPRIVSRWGNDGEYREQSAKLFAGLLHGMKGTPYIYQGEELGMTNVAFELEDYRDIETLNMYRERSEAGYSHQELLQSINAKGRDNARTPMQWDMSENAGFTDGKPWIRVNPNYTTINAQSQVGDENSIFSFYKKVVSLRKSLDVLSEGDFELLYPEHERIFAYRRSSDREKLLVVCNFYGEEVSYPDSRDWEDMECILANYENTSATLKPYEVRWYVRHED